MMITLAQHHQVSPCILQVRQAREFNDFRMLPSETHLRANYCKFCEPYQFLLCHKFHPREVMDSRSGEF